MITAASSVSLNTRRNTVTEKTFGAMDGLLVDGGSQPEGRVGLGRTQDRLGKDLYNARGQCGTFRVETQDTTGHRKGPSTVGKSDRPQPRSDTPSDKMRDRVTG